MIKGDFLASSLDNLVDGGAIVKMETNVAARNFRRKNNGHNNSLKNGHCYFFHIMDEKLEL